MCEEVCEDFANLCQALGARAAGESLTAYQDVGKPLPVVPGDV